MGLVTMLGGLLRYRSYYYCIATRGGRKVLRRRNGFPFPRAVPIHGKVDHSTSTLCMNHYDYVEAINCLVVLYWSWMGRPLDHFQLTKSISCSSSCRNRSHYAVVTLNTLPTEESHRIFNKKYYCCNIQYINIVL